MKIHLELQVKGPQMISHPCAARASKGSKSKSMAPKDSTIAAMAKSKVTIREYDHDRDVEAVEKLERSCEIGTGQGFSVVTNMMGDPLCRIKLFPLHVMLVAEIIGEVVGVARGCVKRVATGVGGCSTVLAGYILGLRVSPAHRRKGVGLKLIKSVEAWAKLHGARHVVAAAEATNVASWSLFVGRCGYAPTAHLSILIQPLVGVWPRSGSSGKRGDVEIERLAVEQAVLLYKRRFGGEPLCPSDVDAVLSSPPSLGTWVARFAGADGSASAWACMSLWNTCASYKLQVVAPRGEGRRALLARLAAVAPMQCMGAAAASRTAPCGEFGFVLAYGIDGEGDNTALRPLVRALWGHAAGAARRVGAECKALVTEAAAGDPIARHVPQGRRAQRVDDVWLVKAVAGDAAAPLAWTSRRRFVDPRDF